MQAGGNASPNLTAIASGTWTFRVDTKASGTFTAGTTHLVVGAWVIRSQSSTVLIDQTIVNPSSPSSELGAGVTTDDANNLTHSSTQTTRAISVAGVPEVTLEADQHLLVRFYYKRYGSKKVGRTVDLIFGADSSSGQVTHPPVSEQPDVPVLSSPPAGGLLNTTTRRPDGEVQ